MMKPLRMSLYLGLGLVCQPAGATPEAAAGIRAEAVASGIEMMQGYQKETLALVGTPAPPINVDEWRGGTAPDWTGKVLLVRFWTVGCDFCEATAPALTDLRERYGAQGLVAHLPAPLHLRHHSRGQKRHHPLFPPRR